MFISEHYHDFLQTYDSYEYDVERADALRYFVRKNIKIMEPFYKNNKEPIKINNYNRCCIITVGFI